MSLIVASLASIAFAAALLKSGLIEATRSVYTLSASSFSTLKDETIDEVEKEILMQRNSIELLKKFVHLTFTAIAVLLAPTIIIYSASTVELVSPAAVFDILLRLDFILAFTIVAVLAARLFRWH